MQANEIQPAALTGFTGFTGLTGDTDAGHPEGIRTESIGDASSHLQTGLRTA
jgi:hypothetical protein